ncbi:MAG TPA: hypothetical protein IGS17_19890 [Oscillatoriales cyanobacterium M59_W2019_021]|nr:MAG: hypothetical protein D6728_18460 [Cyanobacteria bacterium J055]HIK34047.1 hypothetical protein [Oscillatoriales cyanobacterium M4454_W2019_049]HIK53154.1 hypothetical protein [Oscillatoriales cyanobacterium M59_W2019_021]
MNIEAIKLDLIQWILSLTDRATFQEIQKLKERQSKRNIAYKPRQFGCGKGIVMYVADDFDETPPGFEEYML